MTEKQRVWTLVVSDSEGLVGVSVWTTAEAAQQHLATYAAEIYAEESEGQLDLGTPDLISWEKGAIEYGGTEEAWTGHCELTDEMYSLVQQEVNR